MQLSMQMQELDICKTEFRFWFWENIDINPVLKIKKDIEIRKYWIKQEMKGIREICRLTYRNLASYGNDPLIKRWISEMAEIPLCQNEFFIGLQEIVEQAREKLAEIQILGARRIREQMDHHINPNEQKVSLDESLDYDYTYLILLCILSVCCFFVTFRIGNRISKIFLGVFDNLLLIHARYSIVPENDFPLLEFPEHIQEEEEEKEEAEEEEEEEKERQDMQLFHRQTLISMRELDALQSNIRELENNEYGTIIVNWKRQLLSRSGGQVVYGRLLLHFEDMSIFIGSNFRFHESLVLALNFLNGLIREEGISNSVHLSLSRSIGMELNIVAFIDIYAVILNDGIRVYATQRRVSNTIREGSDFDCAYSALHSLDFAGMGNLQVNRARMHVPNLTLEGSDLHEPHLEVSALDWNHFGLIRDGDVLIHKAFINICFAGTSNLEAIESLIERRRIYAGRRSFPNLILEGSDFQESYSEVPALDLNFIGLIRNGGAMINIPFMHNLGCILSIIGRTRMDLMRRNFPLIREESNLKRYDLIAYTRIEQMEESKGDIEQQNPRFRRRVSLFAGVGERIHEAMYMYRELISSPALSLFMPFFMHNRRH
jgi:hypothetical protein